MMDTTQLPTAYESMAKALSELESDNVQLRATIVTLTAEVNQLKSDCAHTEASMKFQMQTLQKRDAEIITLTAERDAALAERNRLDKQNWLLCAKLNKSEELSNTYPALVEAARELVQCVNSFGATFLPREINVCMDKLSYALATASAQETK